jgi:hypothetical protein
MNYPQAPDLLLELGAPYPDASSPNTCLDETKRRCPISTALFPLFSILSSYQELSRTLPIFKYGLASYYGIMEMPALAFSRHQQQCLDH